ncbi:MAG: class I SAM-dependent methyltransferase [Dokdonella sp.]
MSTISNSSAVSQPVTEDAVVWAYRLFLRREPESEAVVRSHCSNAKSLDDIRERFVTSDEFKTLVRGFGPPQLTGFEPRLAIKQVEDPATTQRLLDHVAEAWSSYGKTDPHWSVLTEDRFHKDKLEENFEAFDELGDLHVRRFLATLERNGINLTGTGHCAELGCGVGRLTRWLAPHFNRVTGIDVSPGHLEIARAHVERHVKNVDFMQLRRLEDLATLPSINAFYSFIVLQHNPPPIMEAILERIFERLESGGIAYFQLPTYIPGYSFDAESYFRERGGKLDMEMHVLTQARVFEIAARYGVQPLEAFGEIVGITVSHYFLMRKA